MTKRAKRDLPIFIFLLIVLPFPCQDCNSPCNSINDVVGTRRTARYICVHGYNEIQWALYRRASGEDITARRTATDRDDCFGFGHLGIDGFQSCPGSASDRASDAEDIRVSRTAHEQNPNLLHIISGAQAGYEFNITPVTASRIQVEEPG